jgi:hypothetical protein
MSNARNLWETLVNIVDENDCEYLSLSCKRGKYGELLIMSGNGRWELIRRSKG